MGREGIAWAVLLVLGAILTCIYYFIIQHRLAIKPSLKFYRDSIIYLLVGAVCYAGIVLYQTNFFVALVQSVGAPDNEKIIKYLAASTGYWRTWLIMNSILYGYFGIGILINHLLWRKYIFRPYKELPQDDPKLEKFQNHPRRWKFTSWVITIFYVQFVLMLFTRILVFLSTFDF